MSISSSPTGTDSGPGSVLILLGRILLSIMFILAGFGKLTAIGGTAGYFGSLGLPLPTVTAVVVGLVELLGGLAVLVGFQTRIAAYLLAAFSIVAGYLGHYGQGGEDAVLVTMHSQAFMKDLAIAGGFLVLAIHGAGSLSLDARGG